MSIFRKRERELDEEIASHFRMALRDRLDRGEPYDEAIRAVRREFGNEGEVKETTRQMWGWTWLETLLADIRFACRSIARSPGWAAAVAISLAFGVGANTAIFSLTYAIVLKSLPVPEPGRLIRYGFQNGDQDIGLSGPTFDSLRRHQTASTDLLAWSNAEFTYESNGEAERIKGGLLSGTGFRVLQLRPILGSGFSDADDVKGGGPRGYQALLSYSWWKSRFQESPSVIGRTLRLNGRMVTVAGVLPPDFDGLLAGMPASVVLPLAFEEALHAQPQRLAGGNMWLSIFGRLKPGESIASARANLATIETAVRAEADPKHVYLDGFFKPFHFTVSSGRGGRSFLRNLYQQPLMVLEILAALVLLLCCANTALLIFAQVQGRAREFAVRTAVGAPRARLLRLILMEILILAAAGLGMATLLGWSLAQSLTAMLGTVDMAPSLDVAPNSAILGFTAALTLAAALGSGIFSAIRMSRTDPALNLKQGGRAGTARHTMGRWIIPAQVALSVGLIASAMLLGSSFLNLYLRNAGFRPAGLYLADVDLRPAKLKDMEPGQAAKTIVDSLSSNPAIDSASFLVLPPLHDWFSAGHYFSVDGQGKVHTDMTVWGEMVSPGYFAAMGTRMLAGNSFPRTQSANDHDCVLSQSAAEFFFPNDSPVGRMIYGGGANPQEDGGVLDPKEACRVVGVAENVPFKSLRQAPPRMIYTPFTGQAGGSMFSLAVRTSHSAEASAAIRAAVHQAVPSAPAPTVYSFSELIDNHLNKERMLIRLSSCFGGCALLLTAIGLYGLLMRSVAQRTQEIGVRMALGARRGAVVWSILWIALRHVLVGLAAGAAIAFAAGRAMSSLLYGVTARDPRIYIGSVLVLLLTTVLATILPARRAATIDPVVALREE